jgi:hypothetical protein
MADDEMEEWLVTALQYHARGQTADYGALVNLQGAGADVAQVARDFALLFDVVRSGLVSHVRMDGWS